MSSRSGWRTTGPPHNWWVANQRMDDAAMRLYVKRYLVRASYFVQRWRDGLGETRPPGPLRLSWLVAYAEGAKVTAIAAEAGIDHEKPIVEAIRTAVRRMLVSDAQAEAAEEKAVATGEWRR